MSKIESIDFHHPDITVFTQKNCLEVIEQYKLLSKNICTVYFRNYKKKMTVGKLLYIIKSNPTVWDRTKISIIYLFIYSLLFTF